MIKFTGKNPGQDNRFDLWINPNHIVSVGENAEGSSIATIGAEDVNYYYVWESPEEVVRRIIDYKATMIDFNSYSKGVVGMLVKENHDVYESLREEYERILGLARLR